MGDRRDLMERVVDESVRADELRPTVVPARRVIPPPPARRRRRQPPSPRPPQVSERTTTRFMMAALAIAFLALAASPSVRYPPIRMHTSPGVLTTIERPPAQRARSATPLGVPPAVPSDAGPHRFRHMQPGTDEPVTYDPCRPVHYVVNPRTAPKFSLALLDQAITEVSEVSGLQFVDEGMTDEPPSRYRLPHQAERYGPRWAPVLIAWSDTEEYPDLEGVIGRGGSTPVPATRDGPDVYVTGTVVLDGPGFERLIRREGRGGLARLILVHELGHVLGLDHVEEPGHVMTAEGRMPSRLQPGDLAGFARVGSGPCVREL